ncbi:hypothetical protein [Zhihengliuella sp.]|uniref:hypothetical protein n=1 Tax=Zhihengliuella sp. TaxID=1954483 RepID=UPI002811AC72|nr:hypothetical protein [Zhihengliuella sp.]
MIELPDAPSQQVAAWHALFEIYEMMPIGWTLIGGQAVFLHTIDRSGPVVRATEDADAALDVRERSDMLSVFTGGLVRLGFESAGESPDGHQHRWTRGDAAIDVLIPRWTGERTARRTGVTGGTTIEAPGTQQALARSEVRSVSIGGKTGNINVTSFLGCLIGKAAALRINDDPKWERHLSDALSLLSRLRAADVRGVDFSPAEKAHLAKLLESLEASPKLVGAFPEGRAALQRLRSIARGWNSTDPNLKLK